MSIQQFGGIIRSPACKAGSKRGKIAAFDKFLSSNIILARKTQQAERNFDFEKALKELEQLVEQIEEGDLSLEQSLQLFERGVALTRACQQALQHAEQKVQLLLNEEGRQTLAAFNPDTITDDNDNNET